uniref:Alpha-2-macroglobulin-like n=1 Tax=Electrophorus electricus TaxID=8005 RepID=A0AAY5EWY6_ELEEL
MDINGIHISKRLLLACLLFSTVYGQTSGPFFMVTFPAVIESGSEAKLCASLLRPNETLQMTIYLIHNNHSRTLVEETVEEEFHRCSQFKAPEVDGQSLQEIKVQVKGESFEMTEKSRVLFKSYNTLTFIQTDKPIYNPGQTVNFRLVTMDSNFVPFQQKVKGDNNNNRIGQWTNVSSSGLILQLSHKLNSEAPQGLYKLKANIGNRLAEYHFKVKKYVLPKFEVTVKAPKEQSVGEEELKLEICGKCVCYNALKVILSLANEIVLIKHSNICLWYLFLGFSPQLSRTGCAFPSFNISTFMNPEMESNLQDSLGVTATVTEEGTAISMVKSERIQLTFQIGKVEFLDLPKTFERGTAVEGKIKLTNFTGKVIPNKMVYLLTGERRSPKLLLNLTTDMNGMANFSINANVIPKIQSNTYKTPHFTTSEAHIQLFQPVTPYSPVYSELLLESLNEPLICGREVSITIKYYIVGETNEIFSTDIIYMVLSKGAIVHHGYEKIEVKDSSQMREGKLSFKLPIGAEVAPVVQVLAYCVLPSENIIAASKNFDVEKCFKNKVSLQFSPSRAVPGEENTLQLSALPGSLCGLSAVDQSVFIMEPGDRLNTDKVFRLLPVTAVKDYMYGVEDEMECLHVRPRRQTRGDHVYNTFKVTLTVRYRQRSNGIQTMLRIREHRVNLAGAATGVSAPVETVRKFFPETWIWQLVEVGDSGSAQVPVTVPDTITTWETEAFCLSPQGLGLAPPAELTVFQPFFLELSLPYSIIRGEIFELKATVFNYLPKCIMVKVTPAPSTHYTLKASSDGQYSSCLCASGRKTFKWTLTPSVLGVMNVTVSAEAEQSQTVCDNEIVSVPERGRIDTVTRSLIVQAEGTEKTKCQSWLLCPQGSSVSEELELTLPEDVVEGSARASVSVLGDILGLALKNIDGLLRMPYGCGEQNIALLSPNIYILQYLENTGQLTAAIRERATEFLKSGYQRQLNYKHYSGAYSTFGTGHGNTWLTAFVLRTFGQAQRYIFIDPQNINSAKQWLIGKQRPDGCFLKKGRLFNNRMKGGVNDHITMTAYITASMLELGNTDPAVSGGLRCLKSTIGNLTNTYTTALLAYAFSLAGENDTRNQLLKELESVSISGDGRLHWSQSASGDSDSLAVEISSYVLLAVLTTDQLSTADLGYANRIVSWLVRQQNPYGGFSSTQDTVVALQALALYSTKVFSSDGSSTVTVQSAGGDSHQFDVHQNNKLLYQEKPLQDVSGKYSIEVKGSTCVSVQVSVSVCPVTSFVPSRYNGALSSTNMVIVDIKLLSGFTAAPGEVSISGVNIYFYTCSVPRNVSMNYELHIEQVLQVKNLKPAVIKVYDYYQTSDQSETEYSYPCA